MFFVSSTRRYQYAFRLMTRRCIFRYLWSSTYFDTKSIFFSVTSTATYTPSVHVLAKSGTILEKEVYMFTSDWALAGMNTASTGWWLSSLGNNKWYAKLVQAQPDKALRLRSTCIRHIHHPVDSVLQVHLIVWPSSALPCLTQVEKFIRLSDSVPPVHIIRVTIISTSLSEHRLNKDYTVRPESTAYHCCLPLLQARV